MELINFFKKYRLTILISIGIFILVFIIEYYLGRSFFGTDGHFGFWESSIWSSENSQRFADVYSFSHIIHGMIFYWFLWLIAKKIPVKYRFVIAILMEAVWEIFENSPIIINRYRSVTVSLGYVGDSILNSLSDILMMIIGFIIAKYAKIWTTVLFIIAMELGVLFWVRDNLTLNIIMLVYPNKYILEWQSEIKPDYIK